MSAAESLTRKITFTACGTTLFQSVAVVCVCVCVYIHIYTHTNEMFTLDDINKILSALSQLKGDCLFVYLKTFTQMQKSNKRMKVDDKLKYKQNSKRTCTA
jgi:hypothetical protein